MQNTEDTVKISLRGIGCNIAKGVVDIEVWERMLNTAQKLESSIESALFDLDFFPLLDLPEYKSWRDFNNIFFISGLLYDTKSFIEVRVNKKQKLKVYFRDIWNENLLFPLYNIELIEEIESDAGLKKIVVVESEIGLIASYNYRLTNSTFEIEKLKFSIRKIQVGANRYFNLLTDIHYDNQVLKKLKTDTLVSGGFVFIH